MFQFPFRVCIEGKTEAIGYGAERVHRVLPLRASNAQRLSILRDPSRLMRFRIGAQAEGFTGADIASICQEAKMELVRSKIGGKKTALSMESIERILSKRRPSVTVQHLQAYIKFLEEYGERK